MQNTRRLFFSFIVLFLSASSFAQSVDDRKAAADKWLKRDEIKIQYTGPNYSSVFVVSTKDKSVVFYNSPDRWCAGRPVPAEWLVDDSGTLVFTFTPEKNDCMVLRYAFDPIARSGAISYRAKAPADAAWTSSTSRILLLD